MVEQARYDVLRKINTVDIRSYPRLIIARADGYGDGGFNILFNFITGNNRQKSNVKMTAPVVSEQVAMTAPVVSETGSLAFIMPEEYSLETTPEPLDNRVKIVEVPERTVAALRFSGRWSDSLFRKKSAELHKERSIDLGWILYLSAVQLIIIMKDLLCNLNKRTIDRTQRRARAFI
jgi:hypothetical protein